MSLELARQLIVAAVEAAKVGAPVSPLVIEYDNRVIVDTQTQTKPFLLVKLVYQDSFQADLSTRPTQRFLGDIHLAAAAKEGSGSAEALALLDYLYPQLQRKVFGSVHTGTASPAVAKLYRGWYYYPVLIPFRFDKIY